MTKLISTLVIIMLGLVALGAASHGIAQLLGALVPVILVVGVVVAVLRLVWFYTR